jgi:hypothetical protein
LFKRSERALLCALRPRSSISWACAGQIGRLRCKGEPGCSLSTTRARRSGASAANGRASGGAPIPLACREQSGIFELFQLSYRYLARERRNCAGIPYFMVDLCLDQCIIIGSCSWIITASDRSAHMAASDACAGTVGEDDDESLGLRRA